MMQNRLVTNTFSPSVWHTQGRKGELTSCRSTGKSAW